MTPRRDRRVLVSPPAPLVEQIKNKVGCRAVSRDVAAAREHEEGVKHFEIGHWSGPRARNVPRCRGARRCAATGSARTASPAEIRRRAWCRGAVVPDAGARSGAAGGQVRVLAELGLAGQLRGEVEVSQRHGDRDASRALAMPASMEHLPEPTSCPSRHGLVVQRASCSDEPSATTPSTPTLLTRPKRWGATPSLDWRPRRPRGARRRHGRRHHRLDRASADPDHGHGALRSVGCRSPR